ncbi:MAG: exosortase/archaeosortase family protein [Gemmataceae bacterium]|nr:exosortase/archaeosortase family protein [Gemmataceae bacterium]MCI0740949.1 exosortase/archaeosortase family protein [Gemmataceae bacterium]
MTNDRKSLIVLAIGLALLLVWCYWTSMEEVVSRWANDPQYAQGYFVVAFAAAVLWARRSRYPQQPLQGSWWAIPFVGLAVLMRLGGARFYVESIELVSIIPVLIGCCLALGGWRLLRWASPAILLLVFVLPLPHRLEHALTNPLRRIATSASAYWLQTMGVPAVAEENIILVDDFTIGVVEACSGLGMIITLFALTFTAAFLFRRPLWHKAVVILSAVPIAMLANVLRITLTGVLYEIWGGTAADVFFHDLAGWVMMPVALGILWFEFWILDNLFYEVEANVQPLRRFGLSASTHVG